MDTREMLRIMRNKVNGKSTYDPNNKYSFKKNEDTNKEPSMRDMIKSVSNKLNEADLLSLDTKNIKEEEESKMQDYFKPDQVMIKIEEFLAFENGVFMSGIADNQIQFAFKVTPDEQSSNPDYEVLEGFNPDDPANNELIEKLTKYYDGAFYPYWRDNLVQKSL